MFKPVPHSKFLHKLHQYGIKNKKNHKWLTNFLKESMRTGEKSNETTVDSGVPQGTVLEPILFLLKYGQKTGA
jgi:hypothetical protein